ncbi:hypothetical protein SteCoe_3711 [Stentor coeruleus]|uniref:GOLD domain-containing protein n=1 Tax=Stentor coeruleus TaxID=5963 RepID=A0A1R2CWI7_9CILI|nr:hypothetical protein SteCoe_3711 [Stentor coeruleus]
MLLSLMLITLALSKKNNPISPQKMQNTQSDDNGSETLDVSAEEEGIELLKEWYDKMKGFLPEDMITFEIAARGQEEFYEVIDVIPSTIKGAWFLGSSNSKDMDFTIYDPMQNVVFERKSKKEAFFSIEANYQGAYIFAFKNNKVMSGHTITFTYNSGNSTNTILKTEHLTPVENNLLEIQKNIKDFQVDNQFAQLRQETHFKTVASANTNVFWFSLIESVGVIAVTAWQIYYIKKLLDNRRVL